MPPAITTVAAILEELNRTQQGPWLPLPGFYAMTTASINDEKLTFNPAQGVVLVAFINTQSAEIKTYAAKYLDDVANRELI